MSESSNQLISCSRALFQTINDYQKTKTGNELQCTSLKLGSSRTIFIRVIFRAITLKYWFTFYYLLGKKNYETPNQKHRTLYD